MEGRDRQGADEVSAEPGRLVVYSRRAGDLPTADFRATENGAK